MEIASLVQLDSQDRTRFADAAADLLMTMQPAIADDIAAEMSTLPADRWGLLTAAFMRIVLQHLFQGFPLEVPPAVVQAFLDAGESIEAPLFECEACGYLALRTWTACVLCGGRVGLGAFAVRQGRRASWN